MATFNDPANLPASPDQPAPVQQTDDLSSRWSDWIGKPGNRAAMMQFGVAMLQPMMPGENVLSRFGSSVAQAGEAEARSHQLDVSDEMARNKQELMGSQAQLAQSRAETAGMGSDVKAGRLQLEREKLESTERAQGLNATIKAQQGYQGAMKAKHEYEFINPDKRTEDPTFEEWLPQSGMSLGERPRSVAPQAAPGQAVQQSTKQYLEANPRVRNIKLMPDRKKAKELADKIAPSVVDPDTLYKELNLTR